MVNQASDFSLTVLAEDPAAAVSTAGFEKYAEVQGIGGTGRSIEFWVSLDTLPSSIASVVGDGEACLTSGSWSI